MTRATIDNSADTELQRTITWQYDNATHLVAYIMMLKSIFNTTTRDFWNTFASKIDIADATTPDDFGLAVWGKILNCQRPVITVGAEQKTLSATDYRNILVARLRLLQSKGTLTDYLKYIGTAFGNKVTVADGNDMSLTFTASASLSNDLKALISQYPDVAFLWPAGVRDNFDSQSRMFCFDGQQNNLDENDPNPGGFDDSTFSWSVYAVTPTLVFGVTPTASNKTISFSYIAEGDSTVLWGDGTSDDLTVGETVNTISHTWSSESPYLVRVKGSVAKFCISTGNVIVTSVVQFGDKVRDVSGAFSGCTGLTGTIPQWGSAITNVSSAFSGCTGLTGTIPQWGAAITNAQETYRGCTGLSGAIPQWGAAITNAQETYRGCTGLTGTIPQWGAAITNAQETYRGCAGLTGVWDGAIIEDIMPPTITSHAECVTGALSLLDSFDASWGGAQTDGSMILFVNHYQKVEFPVTRKENANGKVKWGDGSETTLNEGTNNVTHTYSNDGNYKIEIVNAESFTQFTNTNTYYSEDHYSEMGRWGNTIKSARYIVSIGFRDVVGRVPPWGENITSAITAYNECAGLTGRIPEWGAAITNASLAFSGCTGLTGTIPQWGAAITNAQETYSGCTGLTGTIPQWGAAITNADGTYFGCTGLSGAIPQWGAAITDATSTYLYCLGLVGAVPQWGATITNAGGTYFGCTGLTGAIPQWGAAITNARETYRGCTGLTGAIPQWGAAITNADSTYYDCLGLTGAIPQWGADITNADSTYYDCLGLTGAIPQWGAAITKARETYRGCSGLTGVWDGATDESLMPSRISQHTACVKDTSHSLMLRFRNDWGGIRVS